LAVGVEPVFDPIHLHGSIVLALDEALPENLVMTPRISALVGTSAIVIQRFAVRGKIKEAADAKDWESAKVKPAPFPSPPAAEPPVPSPAPAPATEPAVPPEQLELVEWRDPAMDRPIL
jgi:hypothetical protein